MEYDFMYLVMNTTTTATNTICKFGDIFCEYFDLFEFGYDLVIF